MAGMTDIKSPEAMAAEKAAAEAKAKADADAAAEKAAAEAKAKADAASAENGKSVADILGSKSADDDKVTIHRSTLIDIKNENKAVWEELKKVQTMIAEGAKKPDVSDTLKKIGEKYKVDSNFLAEVASAIRAEADADTDRKIGEKVKPPVVEKKEGTVDTQAEADRIDRIFNDHYEKVIAAMPEFKDIVVKDDVKSWTLDPKNANKTFAKIIEEHYGHLVKGKKNIETSKPASGKAPADIDYEKAASDSKYYAEIMADPALKKEYNANLHKRLRL